ncbi:TPA_asm: N [Agave tequilana virus 1]|uniref:Nucleoprotein n=1 Tax=Agave tequilana virus 1 TaxID=2793719 RepID=A0A8D9UIT3_9RHAB|nr:N [Agave tequilana virus 1] [Agave tequilana virus 1]DAF42278.1 TPA_asm: N [Agave tequilana virus 1]
MAEHFSISPEEVTEILDTFQGLPTRENLNPIGNIPDQVKYSDEDCKEKMSIYSISQKADSEIIGMWGEIEKSMKEGKFTEGDMRKLLICALNVRGVEKNTYPFLDFTKVETTKNIITVLDTNPIGGQTTGVESISVGVPPSTSTGETEESKAKAVCFLACMYCRLVVKEDDHVKLATATLQKGFGSLYGAQSEYLTKYVSPDGWSKVIKIGFTTYRGARGTLAAACSVTDANLRPGQPNYGLCRFLLLQHLEFLGMHIYKMTMALVKHMSPVEIGQFLSWVTNPMSAAAAMEVANIVKTYDNKSVRSKLWKYSKLVDPLYFINMSAGRNKYMCCVLAKLTNANALGGTADYSNPEKIRVILNLSNETKNKAQLDCNLVMRMHDVLASTVSGSIGLAWSKSRGVKRTREPEFSPMSEEEEEERPPPTKTPKKKKRTGDKIKEFLSASGPSTTA